ncbi:MULTISPECIES: DUF1054 domain-containing protein [Alkalihalophilus]|uniref:UPF0637 protein RYX45_09555 n=1 Tax=Alkalihalophilus pseudofirmus TaxID=79885 RepID=A0AAJ2NN61_ALKPS|nr:MULTISPECIES: DUF1054 domain-containing protein [Alkalihalophilus]MDV2885431.1 DUF1054 domain-containing protein [Alkalihalophilus pseudofirmus]MEC2072949.1 DUF1054 domain-containing protein [Alkalihalophilus marmarensis]WEG15769.1 DUF1054 domain-containing protein [Alkalihalophilus pseudofirmus]
MAEIEFTQEDFDVFDIEGLDARMEALKTRIRPKFEALGIELAPTLSSMTGDEFFTHVAKHARRKVNPPNDTWVAFAANKRGYKKLPHFQVGLFGTHLFVWFAMIYEAPAKGEFAERLLDNPGEWLKKVPKDFVWSIDHMKPEAISQSDVDADEFTSMLTRLRDVKKAELLCGIHIDRQDPILKDGDALLKRIEETYQHLLPLYQEAQKASVPS